MKQTIKINESTIRKIVAESLSGINAKPVTPSEDKYYVEDGTGSLIRIRDVKDFMYKYEQEKKSGKQTPPLWDWWL